jgi:hypothetical protein
VRFKTLLNFNAKLLIIKRGKLIPRTTRTTPSASVHHFIGIGTLNNFRTFFFLWFFLAGLLMLGVAQRGEAFDTAYWNEFVLRHKLDERFDVHLKTEQWFLSNVSRLGQYNFTPGIKFNWSEHINLEMNYRYQRLKLFDEFTTEHRLEIIPYLEGQWAGFQIQLRNRFELRNIDGDDSFRLRERIQIKRKFKYKDWDFDYYISDEIFYDSNANNFNQNRAKIGVVTEVTPGLNMGLYYLYWTIKGEELFEANVIGTTFSILF